MKGYKNINCSHVETELIELCKAYLNEQFDQSVFRERAKALGDSKYDASDYSFAYLLMRGFLNLFSEYEPDDKMFRIHVEKILSEIENKPYVSESWFVRLEETQNTNVELLYEYWSGSADGALKDKEHMCRELERIEKSKIQHPDSIRDVIYNCIISLMSTWEPSSADVWVNHSEGADACANHKTEAKLNYLFDIWFGKEKIFFQFHYVAGAVYICIL